MDIRVKLGLVANVAAKLGGSGESVRSMDGEEDIKLVNSVESSVKITAVSASIAGPAGVQ